MRIRNIFILLIICIPFIFVSGCSESSQLHRKLIVQGVGIDVEDDLYKTTVQVLDFQNPAGQNQPSVKTFELYGKSVMESLGSMSIYTGLETLYSQNLLLVIGEDVAYKGTEKVMDFFVRYPESRANVKMCVAKGTKASEILKYKSSDDSSSLKSTHDLIENSINSDIIHFVGRLKNQFSDPYTVCLSMQSISNQNVITNNGIAVFDRDVLSGYLNQEEKIGFSLVDGISNIGTCVVDLDNNTKATCKIDNVSRDIKVDSRKSEPEFIINIKVKAELFEIDTPLQSVADLDLKKSIQQKLSEKLKEYSQKAINKSIELNSDIFDFGRVLLNTDRSFFKSKDTAWKNIMKSCKYNIQVESDIKITGKEAIN